MQYWINQNGVQAGPVSLEELKTMHITEEAYVWRSGMSDWQRITTVDELRDLFNERYAPPVSDEAEDFVPEPVPEVVPELEPVSESEPESVPEPVSAEPVDNEEITEEPVLPAEDTIVPTEAEPETDGAGEDNEPVAEASEESDQSDYSDDSEDSEDTEEPAEADAESEAAEPECPPAPPKLPDQAMAAPAVAPAVALAVPMTVTQGVPMQIEQPKQEIPPCPPTNLVWAIITTVLCCILPGLIAIFTSIKVKKAYQEGDYEKAQRYSDWTAWLCIAGIILGLIWSPIQSCLSMMSMMW